MKNYQEEIALLRGYYEQTRGHVGDSRWCSVYAEEKMQHSLQVIGAGNYIMKHEAVFRTRSPEFTRCAVLAYLLHDIGRFPEIKEIYDYEKAGNVFRERNALFDHGERGAEMLSQMPQYNDPRIIIPIRHHGHMIEKFYADPQYQSIEDENLRREIKEIIFLVRDADKIANFYLMTSPHALEKYHDLLFHAPDEAYLYGKISPELIGYMQEYRIINHKDIHTLADDFMGFISWIFDLNYQTSIEFTRRHNIIDGLIADIRLFNHQHELQEKLANYAKMYIQSVNLNHQQGKTK